MSDFRSVGWLVLLAVVPGAVALGQQATTGPSFLDPHGAMQVREDEVSQELLELAIASYAEFRTAIEEYEEARTNNRLQSVNPKRITTTYIAGLDLQWYAERLSLQGEPAGHDFNLRREALMERYRQVVSAYKGLPGVSARLQAGVNDVANISRQNMGVLRNVQGLMGKQEYIKAEETMHPAVQKVFSAAAWYNIPPAGPGNVEPYTRMYGDVRKRLRTPTQEDRRAVAEEAILPVLSETIPKFDELRAQIKSAVSAVGSSGSVNGQTGPQWLVEFGNLWSQSQIDVTKAIGLQLARFSTNAQQAVTDLKALIAAQHQFTADISAEIANLIHADAGRVPPGEARDLYEAYLAAAAPLVALSPAQELIAVLQPALDQLATRSPDLQVDVAAYRAATTDLLRWRERVAFSYVMVQSQSFSPLPATLYAAGKTSTVPEERLYPAVSSGPDQQAILAGPGPVVATKVGAQIVDKKVWVGDLINSRSGSEQLTSSKLHSVYARLPMSIDLTPAVQDLQAALLVKDGFDPLSLEAAVALETARRGDLLGVGGTVTDMVIEGLASRLANADAGDWGLMRLGKVPDDKNKGGVEDIYLPQVVVRVTIEPQWWRHKYFYFGL